MPNSDFLTSLLAKNMGRYPDMEFLDIRYPEMEFLDIRYPEMEFLDINLTKGSSLLLHPIHRPFYWRILKKTILYSGFKNTYKKSAKQENSSLFMNSILKNGKMRVENSILIRPRVYAQKPRLKNVVKEFHLWKFSKSPSQCCR